MQGLIRHGGNLDALRRPGMVADNVEATEHHQQGRDHGGHPLVGRGAAAVDVRPAVRHAGIGGVAVDLLGVDPREVGLDDLGHELGHRRAGQSERVIVDVRGHGRVGAGELDLPLRPIGPDLAGVGIFVLVPDQIAHRQAERAIDAVDRGAIRLAALPAIEQEAPAHVVERPLGGASLHNVFVGRRLGHRFNRSRAGWIPGIVRPA